MNSPRRSSGQKRSTPHLVNLQLTPRLSLNRCTAAARPPQRKQTPYCAAVLIRTAIQERPPDCPPETTFREYATTQTRSLFLFSASLTFECRCIRLAVNFAARLIKLSFGFSPCITATNSQRVGGRTLNTQYLVSSVEPFRALGRMVHDSVPLFFAR